MAWTLLNTRFATGIILLFLGVAIIKFQPYEYIFNKMTLIYPGGITYHFWSQQDAHLIMKVYIFNVTNKDAFLAGKEKLKLQEVGPYIYREDAIHHNVTFNHENGTAFSIPRYTLHWVPEMNQRDENEKLILPHLAMLLFSSKFSYLKLPLNAFITSTKSSPIVEQSVKEFLFGFDNAFIQVGSSLLPFWINFKKIGILDRLYDHEGDMATTHTGELDLHKTGRFATYNNYSVLTHWKAPCNNIEGSSDGKKFGNYRKDDDIVTFYRKGLCRAIPLKKMSSETVNTFGIPTLYYKFEENMFDNGEFNERNKCFCKRNPCRPNTIQEISDCFYGFPVGLSFPHFLNGSDLLRKPFEGLNPDVEKHDSYAFINPTAGYIVNGSVRFQVNALLDDLDGISGAEKFSNMILPLAWADFTPERVDSNVNILQLVCVRILPALETVLAFSFIFIGTFLTVYHFRKSFQNRCGFNRIQNKAETETGRPDKKKYIHRSNEQLHSLMEEA